MKIFGVGIFGNLFAAKIEINGAKIEINGNQVLVFQFLRGIRYIVANYR